MPEPIAVYVHIPFCPSKCGYCDFNSYAMEGEIFERTSEATIAQIRRSPLGGRPAKTIFFGGGTPTFIPVESLNRILDAVRETHPPLDGVEITSEANPGTVDAEKFGAMRANGFNRISLGGQSFSDDDLIRLGRVHKSGEIERAVKAAQDAGFENVNLDLMFGLTGQNSFGWKQNLDRAMALDLQHLSLYCLTIEPNTAFFKQFSRGELSLPDDEVQVDMYNICQKELQNRGFRQYEISNFALGGRECRHNLEYWHGSEYAGYGPGAVASYTKEGIRIRTTNLKHPFRYCDAIEKDRLVECDVEELDAPALRIERIMLGLRLNEGIPIDSEDFDDRKLERLIDRGWIEADNRIRLTSLGRHFCSDVTLELI